MISCSIGNILEWYDFGLFTIFSSLFSRLFFPTTDPDTAMIATVGIFSLGFFCRPIGALIFGYFGDKNGRAKTLRLSILMIVLPTLLIGCIPTYQQIGITAPLLLTIIRMWQGISIGGEYSGSLIYLAEIAPNNKRALTTSLGNIGANLGILFASLAGIAITHLMPSDLIENWGWRIAYIISGVICLLIYIFRLRVHETTIFRELKRSHQTVVNPITTVIFSHPASLLRIIGMICMGSTFYFFCYIYLPIYLVQVVQLSVSSIASLMSTLITCMLVMVPIAAFICDLIGRRKLLLFNSFLITVLIVPGFYFLHTQTFGIIFLILGIFTLASSLEQGTTPVAIIENFPANTRYTGVSLGYNIGNGFLGGTVPLICEWLLTATHFSLTPALYITFWALVTFVVIYFFVPETKGKSLI